jgi:hypothetical protein
LSGTHRLGAQTLADLTSTPASTADSFLRSVRAIDWRTTALVLDETALTRFRNLVTAMADADSTGSVRDYLTAAGSVGLAELTSPEVFERAVGVLVDDMPGLMHALYDRDDEVIGHVLEGPDGAHVVYRTTARISGAVSEVKIVQLRRTEGGWRVLWSDELEVLDAALRGVPLRPR